MKKILLLGLLGATSSLMAINGEFAYLYKDPRIMGMGGANVAVGAYSTSVFSNPAGLVNIKKEHGYVVDILSVGVSASAKGQDFATELGDASGIEDVGESADAVNSVIAKYSGDVFSAAANNYMSVSKNSELFAWSVGLLAASDLSLVVHGNGSGSGAALEAAGRAYGGFVLAGAKPYTTEYGVFDVGVGLKYISQISYEGPLYISDLTDENASDTLQDIYKKTVTGFGLDLGVNYHPKFMREWKPAIGLSIMNIGAMDMEGNYGYQPMTVNVGISLSHSIPYLEEIVFAADYVDIFNANTIRIYDYPDSSTGTIEIKYRDYTDSDFMKRLRLGVGLTLIDSQYFSTTLNGGLYQDAYTAGLNMELLILKLNLATYEEQVGTGNIDIKDRRYMAQVGIGW